MQRIYFDNAATTPLAPEVIDTMHHAMKELWGNPSSIYQEGRTARAAVEAARKQVAGTFKASIGELFFTSCGTESNNTVLKCSVRDLGVQRIISARTEHHAVTHTLDTLRKHQGIAVDWVEQDHQGHIQLDHLEELLKASGEQTLVSLMYANNEIGTMIDLVEVGNLCRSYGAYFHSDTVQTIGYYPIDLSTMPVHFITGSAHKFYGPKGTGFLYINSDAMLHPFIDGGAQERNMRGGTENIYGILGLAKALELSTNQMEANREKIEQVRNYFAERLQNTFEDIQLNGDPFGQGHYKILSVSFPPSSKADLLLLHLDIAGISVSGGSACSSGADAGSHVLDHLFPGSLRKTIRFSFSHNNTMEEADFVLKKIREILPEPNARKLEKG